MKQPMRRRQRPRRKGRIIIITEHHLARVALARENGDDWVQGVTVWTRTPGISGPVVFREVLKRRKNGKRK